MTGRFSMEIVLFFAVDISTPPNDVEMPEESFHESTGRPPVSDDGFVLQVCNARLGPQHACIAARDDPQVGRRRSRSPSNMDMGKISISNYPSTHPRFGPSFYKQTLDGARRACSEGRER